MSLQITDHLDNRNPRAAANVDNGQLAISAQLLDFSERHVEQPSDPPLGDRELVQAVQRKALPPRQSAQLFKVFSGRRSVRHVGDSSQGSPGSMPMAIPSGERLNAVGLEPRSVGGRIRTAVGLPSLMSTVSRFRPKGFCGEPQPRAPALRWLSRSIGRSPLGLEAMSLVFPLVRSTLRLDLAPVATAAPRTRGRPAISPTSARSAGRGFWPSFGRSARPSSGWIDLPGGSYHSSIGDRAGNTRSS